jgi:hypothetical protein
VTYGKRDESSNSVPCSFIERAFAPDARVRPRVPAEERFQLGGGVGILEIIEKEMKPMVIVIVEVGPN